MLEDLDASRAFFVSCEVVSAIFYREEVTVFTEDVRKDSKGIDWVANAGEDKTVVLFGVTVEVKDEGDVL